MDKRRAHAPMPCGRASHLRRYGRFPAIVRRTRGSRVWGGGAAGFAVVASIMTADSAWAYRLASRPETTAIQMAIRSYLPHCSMSSGRLVFRGAYISTANPRYAEGRVDDNMHTCYAFAFFLKRPSLHDSKWVVVGEFPDSVVACSSFRVLPEPVIRDFHLEGERPQGGLGPC